MKSSYDTFTKDKTKVSYEFWIEKALIDLGFYYSNRRIPYLKKLILYAFENKLDNISMKDLYIELSKQMKISHIAIESAVKYTVKMVDISS